MEKYIVLNYKRLVTNIALAFQILAVNSRGQLWFTFLSFHLVHYGSKLITHGKEIDLSLLLVATPAYAEPREGQ